MLAEGEEDALEEYEEGACLGTAPSIMAHACQRGSGVPRGCARPPSCREQDSCRRCDGAGIMTSGLCMRMWASKGAGHVA